MRRNLKSHCSNFQCIDENGPDFFKGFVCGIKVKIKDINCGFGQAG